MFKKITFLLFSLSVFLCNAQTPGDIAQSFGSQNGFNNLVRTVALQADGKLLVGGDFTTYKGGQDPYIIRLNADGSKDATFATGTGFNGPPIVIKQQTDGKLIIGGAFSSYNGVTENRIIRLNTDGSKDATFNTGTGFNNGFNTLILQADGKILVGGTFTSYNGVTENSIIRLNSDGSKDVTFATTGTGFTYPFGGISSIEMQADGKILVGGNFTAYNGVTENRIIRLNSDGSKDATFITGTGFNEVVSQIKTQTDGKILITGSFTTYKGVTETRIIRLNNDGSKDPTFITGTGFNNTVVTLIQQADGKILVGGFFSSYKGLTENKFIRLNNDGSKDTTFTTGEVLHNGVYTIVPKSDGKIIVVGDFISYNGVIENRIFGLNSDGSRDASFDTGTGLNNLVRATKQQADGKVLLIGEFNSYKKVTENRIIRLNSDGTKDVTFATTGTGFNYSIHTIELQADGKILAGGLFNDYNGVPENRIIRLNSDGSKDNTFVTGTGFAGSGSFIDESVDAIKQQADGKILIGGNCTSYNGVTENRIIRLNSDGSKDATFATGTGFDDIVQSIELQADGKILIAGGFTTYNGVTENRIIRLNSDGSKDATFATGTGFNDIVQSIELQADGKILVGGTFTSYNGVTENRIVRLNSDGSKDATFATGTGFNSGVRSIEEQSNGKILVGGDFITYKGVTENRIICLNSDGSKDAIFNTGTGFNSPWVQTIKQLADGTILVGGHFTTYKGDNSSAFLIKLHTEVSRSNAILTQIGNEGDAPNTVTSIVTVAQLGQILPAITGIVAANESAYQAYIDANPALFSAPATAAEVQAMVTAVNAQVAAQAASNAVLAQIGNEGDAPNTVTSVVTVAQLGQIIPAITGIVAANESAYQEYIDANPTLFSSPATAAEVQAMVDTVNTSLSTTSFDIQTIVVYPNPSSAIFNIVTDMNATFELYDIAGKSLKSDTIAVGTSVLDLSSYANGVYFLKIFNENNQTKTVRIIKQ